MPNAPTLPGRSALPVVLVLLWLTAGWAGTPLPATGAAGDEATGTDSGNVDFELSYNSIFTQYHTFRDEAISSWPEANDTVGRIGGCAGRGRTTQAVRSGCAASKGSGKSAGSVR